MILALYTAGSNPPWFTNVKSTKTAEVLEKT